MLQIVLKSGSFTILQSQATRNGTFTLKILFWETIKCISQRTHKHVGVSKGEGNMAAGTTNTNWFNIGKHRCDSPLI